MVQPKKRSSAASTSKPAAGASGKPTPATSEVAPAPALQALTQRVVEQLKKGDDDSLHLDAAGVATLGEELANCFGTRELVDVVQELVTLAYYLDTQRGSPDAARAIVDQLQAAIPHLRKLGVNVDTLLHKDAIEDSGKFAAMKNALGDKGRAVDPRMEKPRGGPGGALGLFARKDKK